MEVSFRHFASISSACSSLLFFFGQAFVYPFIGAGTPLVYGSRLLTSLHSFLSSFEDPYGKEPREANTVQTSPTSHKTAPNELGIDWGISPLEVAQWDEDDRLVNLEDWVYDDGFIPNAAGF